MARKNIDGRFVVSGPYEDEKIVSSVGMGCSAAQSWATKYRKVANELTYYVRDLTGQHLIASVTKEKDGSITTRTHSAITLAAINATS